MNEEGEKLEYSTTSGSLSLTKDGETLEITSKGIDPTESGLGFCGAHADISGLKFSINSKGALTCPSHK